MLNQQIFAGFDARIAEAVEASQDSVIATTALLKAHTKIAGGGAGLQEAERLLTGISPKVTTSSGASAIIEARSMLIQRGAGSPEQVKRDVERFRPLMEADSNGTLGLLSHIDTAASAFGKPVTSDKTFRAMFQFMLPATDKRQAAESRPHARRRSKLRCGQHQP